MATAKLTKADISDVILVGGSIHNPGVRELFENYFRGNCRVRDMIIAPDEAVAVGAAIAA